MKKKYIMNMSQYARASKRTFAVVCSIARNNNIGDVVMNNRVRTIMLDEDMINRLEATRKNKDAIMSFASLKENL